MDALLEVGTQSLIGEDIDFALEEGFQFLTEFDQVQQTAAMVHLDQEINVAGWPGLSSGGRTKYTDVVSAVLCRKLEDVASFGSQHISGSHDTLLCIFAQDTHLAPF